MITVKMSPLLRIITVIMSPSLRIITRSIIRNNGFIITYHRPGQLGDVDGKKLNRLLISNTACPAASKVC